jgi:hypothetical protein
MGEAKRRRERGPELVFIKDGGDPEPPGQNTDAIAEIIDVDGAVDWVKRAVESKGVGCIREEAAQAAEDGAWLGAVQAAFDRARYRYATRIIDAQHFVPQSRERYFVIGAHRDLNIDPEPMFEGAMLALPDKRAQLADVIDLGSDFREYHSQAEVARYLTMLSPEQRTELDALRARKRPIAVQAAKRMRGPKGARMQRIEIQPDLAYALKVVSKGGSSHQFLFIVDGPQTRLRAINPREAAGLMGLSDSYVLPRDPFAALDLCGDGLCVPVVRHLATHVLEPLLNDANPSGEGFRRTIQAKEERSDERPQYGPERVDRGSEEQFAVLPLDVVIENLESLAAQPDLPEDLAEKVKGYVARLKPAFATLDEVEWEFLYALASRKKPRERQGSADSLTGTRLARRTESPAKCL